MKLWSEERKSGSIELHRLGHQGLDAAGLALLGPQLHRDRRDKEKIQPWMEGEERIEVGLAALVEVSEIEREDVGEEQEDDDENVRERRREVARELAAHDDAHVAHDAAGPQAVMVRNTSSRDRKSVV